MARINIDDDVESREQFWRLLQVIGGDRDAALGKLVRFFRIGLKRYGRQEVITLAELEEAGLKCMVESGWAVKKDDGFEALGAERQFKWYLQKVEAGKKGGRPPKPTETGREPAETGRFPGEPGGNRPAGAVNPPAPSPAPDRSSSSAADAEEGISADEVAARAHKPNENLSTKGTRALLQLVPEDVQEKWLDCFDDVGWLKDRLAAIAAYALVRGTPIENYAHYVTNWLNKDWKDRSKPARRKSKADPGKEKVSYRVRSALDGEEYTLTTTRSEYDRWCADFRTGRNGTEPPPLMEAS